MRLTWANQAPTGITFDAEEELLTTLESLARQAGYEILDTSKLDFDSRSLADVAIQTDKGRLYFGVRQKSRNDIAKIDIETRPKLSYRTRHVLLQRREGNPWELRNDSNLPEGVPPTNTLELAQLVDKLFS